MHYSSKLIENAVSEISKLPGIGQKTALRLALHLLKQDINTTDSLTSALSSLRKDIKYCKQCHYISDTDICSICSSPARDKSLICIVESSQDVMAIEATQQFKGLYHVLGGVISPMEGVSPSDLNIETLLERINKDKPSEVIFALNPTMEGDTTTFYITKKLRVLGIEVSTIARGIPIGSELEYADELTLGRSIITRQPYQ